MPTDSAPDAAREIAERLVAGWNVMTIKGEKARMSQAIAAALRAATQKAKPTWQPENTAPQRKVVLVRGKSGWLTHPTFYIAAYLDEAYRPGRRWLTVQNDLLADWGWQPVEWMELP